MPHATHPHTAILTDDYGNRYTEGLAKGQSQGKAEGIALVIQNMRSQGLEVEDIARYCGLEVVRVRAILSQTEQ